MAETRPESQDVEQEQDPSSPATPTVRTEARKKRKTTSTVEQAELELLNNINKKMNHQNDDDSDRSFLLSLLPDLKNIHEDFKLDLKTEMMVLLKKYKNLHNHQSHFQNQPPQYAHYSQSSQVPSCEYTNLTSAPGHFRTYYNTQTELSALGPSHNFNNIATTPVAVPSPAPSISSHSHSDGSVIKDLFHDIQ